MTDNSFPAQIAPAFLPAGDRFKADPIAAVQHLPVRLLLAIALGAWGLVPTSAPAQESQLSRDHHAWARFEPGAWKRVRVTTETLDPEGSVTSTSTTDTTTLLESVEADSYSLEVAVSLEVAGKKFEADPQFVTQGYYGELEEPTPVFAEEGAATVAIEGKQIPCQIYAVKSNNDRKQRSTKLYYAKNFAPYLLRKESVSTDPAANTTLYETTEEVIAIDMPYRVMTETIPTAHVKTVRKNSKGTTITLAVHTADVPGGVVAYTSKELDSAGQTIRRSRLELIDYGLEPDRRILGRRQFKRYQRANR